MAEKERLVRLLREELKSSRAGKYTPSREAVPQLYSKSEEISE